jgi:hypothetical protein
MSTAKSLFIRRESGV